MIKTEKSQGMKGRVTVTLNTEETMGEVLLSRGGKLGLASPAAPGRRPHKPFGGQKPKSTSVPVGGIPGHAAWS
jgi:hypothetical protein